jgi:hypothetical protein
VLIFTSANRVYGNTPLQVSLLGENTRWEQPEDHPDWPAIDESKPIDRTKHSVSGASKVANDVLLQENDRASVSGLRESLLASRVGAVFNLQGGRKTDNVYMENHRTRNPVWWTNGFDKSRSHNQCWIQRNDVRQIPAEPEAVRVKKALTAPV